MSGWNGVFSHHEACFAGTYNDVQRWHPVTKHSDPWGALLAATRRRGPLGVWTFPALQTNL